MKLTDGCLTFKVDLILTLDDFEDELSDCNNVSEVLEKLKESGWSVSDLAQEIKLKGILYEGFEVEDDLNDWEGIL